MRLGARSVPIEYYILRAPNFDDSDLRVENPVVGYLADRPIRGTFTDAAGHRYRYAGLAPRLRDGRFDVDSLRPGEWIVEPGLVYVADDAVTPK